jgi:hypothetical protein
MERFNIKKLNEVEGKEQHHVEISNRFAALENTDTEVDLNYCVARVSLTFVAYGGFYIY